MIDAFPRTIGRSGRSLLSKIGKEELASAVLYNGCRAAVVVQRSPEQQIWRKIIEAVEVMGPDKLIAGSGSG